MSRLETIDVLLMDQTNGFTGGGADDVINTQVLPDNAEVIGYRVRSVDATGGFTIETKWRDVDGNVSEFSADNDPDSGFSMVFAADDNDFRAGIRRNTPQHFYPNTGESQITVNITGLVGSTTRIIVWAIARKGAF